MKIYCCGDCGVMEGELHDEGCDQERCSKCSKQVLVWGRCKNAKPEPYFYDGFSCVRCGKFRPDLDMVLDKDWEFICGGTYPKDCVLCIKCMNFIKQARNKKEKNERN